MFSHNDDCMCLDDVSFKTDIGSFKKGTKADEVLINLRTKKLKINCEDQLTIFSFAIVVQPDTETKVDEDSDFEDSEDSEDEDDDDDDDDDDDEEDA